MYISALYVITLFRRISPPSTNINLHRQLCTIPVLFLSLLLVSHAIPTTVYIVLTRHSQPSLRPALAIVSRCRTAALLATLLSLGSMRRGPRLRHEPMRLGTSFGVNADPADQKTKPNDEGIADESSDLLGRKGGEVSNVLDYRNSAMLALVLQTYVRTSGSVRSLSELDLTSSVAMAEDPETTSGRPPASRRSHSQSRYPAICME